MLSGHLFPSVKSVCVHYHTVIFSHWFVFFIFVLLLGATDGIIAASNSHRDMESSGTRPRHFSFFRSTLRGRQRFLSCDKDSSVCLDREKNPWGGSTCCFQRFCKDTRNDPNHCGGCGKICAFGLICCDGKCIDNRSDPQHCGACFEVCPGQTKCSYSMCDYGG